jgi:hypothetical protein
VVLTAKNANAAASMMERGRVTPAAANAAAISELIFVTLPT